MNQEYQDEMQTSIGKMGVRLSAIEMWRDDMKAEIVTRLLEQFTERINSNI
jgi:hypothetical protein